MPHFPSRVHILHCIDLPSFLTFYPSFTSPPPRSFFARFSGISRNHALHRCATAPNPSTAHHELVGKLNLAHCTTSVHPSWFMGSTWGGGGDLNGAGAAAAAAAAGG